MALVRIAFLQVQKVSNLMSASDQPCNAQCDCWFQAERRSDVKSRVSPSLTGVGKPMANIQSFFQVWCLNPSIKIRLAHSAAQSATQSTLSTPSTELIPQTTTLWPNGAVRQQAATHST